MPNNPFTTSFGKEPENFISRPEEENKIIETFLSEKPSQQVFMITGVRGSGKTVLLTRVRKRLTDDNQWISVELSSEGDLIKDLIAKLCDDPILRVQFMKAKINLSLFGISLNVEESAPVNSTNTALEKMLKVIKRLNKRLLITIDEVTADKSIRIFASEFQILMREEFPVFLIMTGLFKNIYDLQNEKTLTFLYRAPKIVLGALNNIAVINSYKRIFSVSTDKAAKMASHVLGYAFAYQLYGSLCFEADSIDDKEVISRYNALLGELVYEKLWSELSTKDREIMTVLADHRSEPVKVSELINDYNRTYPDNKPLNDKLMSVYRERLKKEGLIVSPKYGYIQMALPSFSEYVKEYGIL